MCLPFSRRSIDFHRQSSINSILPTLFCPCNISDVNKMFTVEFLIILSLCRGPRGKSSQKKTWEWSLINCAFFLFSLIQQSCSRAVKAWEACDSTAFIDLASESTPMEVRITNCNVIFFHHCEICNSWYYLWNSSLGVINMNNEVQIAQTIISLWFRLLPFWMICTLPWTTFLATMMYLRWVKLPQWFYRSFYL